MKNGRPCCLLVLALLGCARPPALILASTTSTVDTGLFDVLVPAFEQAHGGVRVRVLAVGSGEALALGQRGDADVLVVHSPGDEEAFMRAGHGVRRLPVMWNDFVIVGPAADPAGLRDLQDAAAAMQRIAQSDAPFVSRADGSGTHRKELELLRLAGLEPDRLRRRSDAGQGMAEVLVMAAERAAYTLTDRATFLFLEHTLDLEILVEGDARLGNPYSVITATRARDARLADAFADWLASPEAARLIESFGTERFGSPLFRLPAGT